MENYVNAVNKWCASKRLQLNPSQMEVIWLCTSINLKKLQSFDLSLHVGADIIIPVDAVHDLGVILDSELTMAKHIAKITSISYFHLQCLKQVRWILSSEIAAQLV